MYIHVNKFTVLSDICSNCNLIACDCVCDEQYALNNSNILCDVHNMEQRFSPITLTKQVEEVNNDVDSIMQMSEESSFHYSNHLNDDIICNDTMRPSFSVHATLKDNSYVSSVELNSSISVSDEVPVSISLNDESSTLQSQSVQQTRNLTGNNITEEISQVDLGFKCKGFRIGHINVQGLGNKFDQIKLMLNSNQNQIQILGLSETKLKDIHVDSFFEVNGYQKPFRRDRKQNSGGGLLVYVKNEVSCKRRPDLESEQLECIWLEVKPMKSKSFLVGHVYRPPNSGIVWNELFEDSIENVLREEKEMYILGDINRDLLNDQIKKAWTDYMEPFGLTQLVSEATRVTPDSSTLIDHVYSNCPENVTSINVPKIGLSDHFPVFFTRKMHVQPAKRAHYTIKYRSFKNFDENNFYADLQAVPWNLIHLFDDTDDALEAWNDLFLEVVDKNIPIKEHRVKHRNQPQWLTPDILDAMKCRDRHKSLGNDAQYKYWRNKVISLIRKAKQEKYETYIETNKEKPGSILKLFQEVGAGKGAKKQSSISSIKTSEDQCSEDPAEIADTFNDFFVNIASKIKEPVSHSNHDKLKDFCQDRLPDGTRFEIPCIDMVNVRKYLSNVDVSKATGTDNIGPRLLKLAAPYIASEITYICNKSISTSSFPNKWKEAKVSPLHKQGPSDDINNYRPISILPVLSKILERHVSDCLLHYLNENNLLHKTQSGFRSQHSCETALTHMIDSWLEALDHGQMVGLVLVDFNKAFDLVDHKILLRKLEMYGINNETLQWFTSYLTERRQQVKVNNSQSSFKPVTCGVPQGSILGPLLFLLFINDLPLYTIHVFTDLYADDTTLYFVHSSQEVIEQNLQIALNELQTWCKNNGMVLNSAKTKVMFVTTSQKRQRLIDDNLKLFYNNDALHTITNDKILGVFVDNNLTWSEHVKHVTKKIASNIWLLSKIKAFLSKELRVQFYKSYIQPHIDFCNIVWGSTSEANKLKIYRLQKRACRVILDYNVEDSKESMKSLKIQSVYDRLFLRKAKFMFKVFNESAPKYITETFTLRSNVNTSLVLRSATSQCYVPPKPRTEGFKQSMRYSGCLIWNSSKHQIWSLEFSPFFVSICFETFRKN